MSDGNGAPAKKPLAAVKPKFAPRTIPRAQTANLNSRLPGPLPNLLSGVKLEPSDQSPALDRERAVRGGRGRGRGHAERTERERGRGRGGRGRDVYTEQARVAFVASTKQSSSSSSSAASAAPALARQIKQTARTRGLKKEEDDGVDSLLKEDDVIDDDARKLYEPIDYFGEVVGEDEEEAAGKLKVKAKPAVKKVEKEEQIAAKQVSEIPVYDYFSKGIEKLAFIQFPAKLPKELSSEKDEVNAPEPQKAEQGAEIIVDVDAEARLKAANAKSRQDLSSFGSGRLGTLRVYRSGKVKLVIGDVQYELTNGVTYPFEQDLASIKLGTSETPGVFKNLGPVESRITCSLDI